MPPPTAPVLAVDPQVCEQEVPQVDGLKEWWLSRATSLPDSSLNGWVLSCMLDEYANEAFIAKACEKPTFEARVASAGLTETFNATGGPRERCRLLARAGPEAAALLTRVHSVR